MSGFVPRGGTTVDNISLPCLAVRTRISDEQIRGEARRLVLEDNLTILVCRGTGEVDARGGHCNKIRDVLVNVETRTVFIILFLRELRKGIDPPVRQKGRSQLLLQTGTEIIDPDPPGIVISSVLDGFILLLLPGNSSLQLLHRRTSATDSRLDKLRLQPRLMSFHSLAKWMRSGGCDAIFREQVVMNK